MRTRIRAAVAATACTFALTSCASLDVNTIPAPGASYDDGYDSNDPEERELLEQYTRDVLGQLADGEPSVSATRSRNSSGAVLWEMPRASTSVIVEHLRRHPPA